MVRFTDERQSTLLPERNSRDNTFQHSGSRDHKQQVSGTATNNCIPQPEPETGMSLHCRTSSSHQPCLPASLMRGSPSQEAQPQSYGTEPVHKLVVVNAKQHVLPKEKHTTLNFRGKKLEALEACYRYEPNLQY